MTRIAPLLLALALGACDSAAPSSGTDATSVPAPMANAKSDAVHRITEAVSVFVEGDRVLLKVEGQVVDLGAGEAYLVGQTLARIGYETLSPELAEVFPPPRGGIAIFDSLEDFLKVHVKSHPSNRTIITFEDGEQKTYGESMD